MGVPALCLSSSSCCRCGNCCCCSCCSWVATQLPSPPPSPSLPPSLPPSCPPSPIAFRINASILLNTATSPPPSVPPSSSSTTTSASSSRPPVLSQVWRAGGRDRRRKALRAHARATFPLVVLGMEWGGRKRRRERETPSEEERWERTRRAREG